MAPPVNDLWINAIAISVLPFSAAGVVLDEATESVDDPNLGAVGSGVLPGDVPMFQTVWWVFTPTVDQVVQLVTTNTKPFGVFTGSPGSFVEVVSQFAFDPATVTWAAQAGVQYSIIVGTFDGLGGTTDVTLAVSSAAPNQFMETALDLSGSYPIIVNADSTGATDNGGFLWFKYTPVEDDNSVISFYVHGAVDVAVPNALSVYYQGPVTYDPYLLPIEYPLGNGSQSDGTPIYLQTEVGLTIYLYVRMQLGDGPFLVEVHRFTPPSCTVAAGNLLSPMDVSQCPACILSSVNGTILHLPVPFAGAGGQQDGIEILNDGTIAAAEQIDTTFTVRIYDGVTLTEVASAVTAEFPYLSTNKTSQFYLGYSGGGPFHSSFQLLSTSGGLGPLITLPLVGLQGLGVSPDETIFYYSVGGPNEAIHRWNLLTNTPMSDLTAGPVGGQYCAMGIVLADGSVLCGFAALNPWAPPATVASITVYRYSAAGAMLNAYVFTGATFNSLVVFRAIDDPDSFWAMQHIQTPGSSGDPVSDAVNRYNRVRTSDGAILTTFDVPQFTGGQLDWDPEDPPPLYFGPSNLAAVVLRVDVTSGVCPPEPPPTVGGCDEGLPVDVASGQACDSVLDPESV